MVGCAFVGRLFGGEVHLHERVHPIQDPAKVARHIRGERLADVGAGGPQLISELCKFDMVASEDRGERRRTRNDNPMLVLVIRASALDRFNGRGNR